MIMPLTFKIGATLVLCGAVFLLSSQALVWLFEWDDGIPTIGLLIAGLGVLLIGLAVVAEIWSTP